LWVPNQHVVVGFDPAAATTEAPAYPALLDELLADGVPLRRSENAVFRVPPATRRLEFHYSSPALSAPEQVRFLFRLKGYDTEWVAAQSRRTAYYPRVPPDRYEFEVVAGGRDGVWRASARRWPVEVLPQVWERTSLRLAAAVAVLLAAGVLFWRQARARLWRRLARLEARQAMERERARIAQDLHDDVGSRLTELVLVSESVHRDAVTSPEIQSRTGDMTRKLRHTVAAMDQIVWTVNPEHDTLPDLADYLSNYAQEFLAPTPIRCRLDVAEDLPDAPLPAQTRHHLLLAVKEALNNAVKHAGASILWLRIQTAPGELRIRVDDNGGGFDPLRPGNQGNGLRNMQNRIESLGGEMLVRSAPGGGTSVEFRLVLPPAGNGPEPA
jgi:signal transduction histidine kinase